jgi:hypothetical protein
MTQDEGAGGRDTEAAKRAITRRDFEAVIRRAAELSSAEAEGLDEALSEDEVLRIATELGLPDKYVRQALFELPELSGESVGRGDYFGEPVLTATRVVPGRAEEMLRRMEDYLTTREYLQTVRRRADRAFFMPAEDAISNLARGLLRPSRRYFLSRAHRVVLSVRPMEEDRAHVQIALDLSEQRKRAVRSAWVGGIVGGTLIGGAATLAVAFADLPTAISAVAHVTAFAAGFAGTLSATLATSRAAFRRALAGAKFELEGLLDRAEHGQTLEPPPAPWRKRLQQKLLGHG